MFVVLCSGLCRVMMYCAISYCDLLCRIALDWIVCVELYCIALYCVCSFCSKVECNKILL